MDYRGQVQKSANLHIQDGRYQLICIYRIKVKTLQPPIFIRSSQHFFLTPSDELSCLSFENQGGDFHICHANVTSS